LLPPNDGLLKANDDLLPPNDGLLPANEIFAPLLYLSARPMPTKNGPRPTFAPPEGAAKAAKCLTNGRAAASLHAYTRFPLTDAEKSSHEKKNNCAMKWSIFNTSLYICKLYRGLRSILLGRCMG